MQVDVMKKVMEINIWHLFILIKRQTHWKSKKNYGEESKILFDQEMITQVIAIKIYENQIL